MEEKKLKKRQRKSSTSHDETNDDEGIKKKKLEVPKDVAVVINQEIKDNFFKLPSINPTERKDAMKFISELTFTAEQEEYIINRLAAGCAAGQRAARLSFPPTLATRLKQSVKRYTIEELEAVANEKIPIHKKSESNNEAIGQVLFYTAVVNSGRYKKAVDLLKIAKILHQLYQKFDHIKFAVAMALVDIAQIVGEHYFSPHFLPVNLLPNSLQTLQGLQPEQFYLLLQLREVLIDNGYSCKKYFKQGKFLFKEEFYPEFIDIVKTCVGAVEKFPLCDAIYRASLDAGVSMKVFKEIFYPAFKFDDKNQKNSESYWYLILLVKHWLNRNIISLNDCIAIFSDSIFLKRLGNTISLDSKLGLKDNILPHVTPLITELINYLKEQNLSSDKLVNFILTVHEVPEDADVDRFFDQSTFTMKLLSLLDESGMEILINKMLETPQDFIVNALFEILPAKHPKLTIEHRIEFIQKAAEPSSSMVHETLSQLFAKPLRESHRIVFTDDGEETIQKLAKKFAGKEFNANIKEKDVEAKKQYEALKKISCLYFILHTLTIDEDEILFYSKVAENFEAMIQQKEMDIEDIFSKILEMIARKGKVNRLSGFYLTTIFATAFKQEQLIKLAETIKKSDWAIVTGDDEGDGEEDDQEFAPITAEELASIKQDRDEGEEEASNQESEEDSSGEEGEGEDDDESDLKELSLQKPNLTPEGREPHPKMVAALHRALGRYAATEDDNEEDVDMDDEELAAIDQRLSNVMKCFSAKGRKVMIQEAKRFRSIVAEVFGLTLELASIKEILTFLPKFFEIMKAVDEKGNQEMISAIIVATNALSHRVESEENVSKLSLKLYKDLCEITDKIHNAQMKAAITNLAIFLFKNIKGSTDQKSVVKLIVQEMEKYFTEGNRSSKYTALFEIVKRNPSNFVDNIGNFFDLFKKTKESKKGEAANFVAIFNRRDLISSHKKAFTSLATKIVDHFKPKVEKVKSGDISFAMKIFLNETAIIRH